MCFARESDTAKLILTCSDRPHKHAGLFNSQTACQLLPRLCELSFLCRNICLFSLYVCQVCRCSSFGMKRSLATRTILNHFAVSPSLFLPLCLSVFTCISIWLFISSVFLLFRNCFSFSVWMFCSTVFVFSCTFIFTSLCAEHDRNKERRQEQRNTRGAERREHRREMRQE